MKLIINWIFLIITDVFLVLLLVSSILEKEKRAALLSFLAAAVNSGIWIFFILYLSISWVSVINTVVLVLSIVMVVLSLIKFFPSRPVRELSNVKQYDERDYMFSRNMLQFHPHLAEKYYSVHPGKKEIDQKIHQKPELGEPGHVFYDKYYSPVFDAAFTYLHRTRSAAAGGESVSEKKEIQADKFVRAIKEIACYYGAVDVGIIGLKPYHFYSHAGRHGENWGETIRSTHRTAIVIVAAMDINMIKLAPALPVILESSRQYVEAAKIANIIAQYIRSFGYDARAHTDGNYQVLCVPAAVDAGLGELGRIGLLVHPVHGPCVRLSVITTQLELQELLPTKKKSALSTIEFFCDICKKCADNCPSHSICKEEEPSSRGFKHWSVNQETCFSYWKNVGTDCGFCIRVCPYTKPDTLVHKLVRFYISRNPINQRIALLMDNFFYARKKSISNKNPHRPFASGKQKPL
jgi:ferredoxin